MDDDDVDDDHGYDDDLEDDDIIPKIKILLHTSYHCCFAV
jgi:hypothetical protein